MRQSLVMIGQATSEIRWRKKKEINDSGKTMAGGQHCWRVGHKQHCLWCCYHGAATATVHPAHLMYIEQHRAATHLWTKPIDLGR